MGKRDPDFEEAQSVSYLCRPSSRVSVDAARLHARSCYNNIINTRTHARTRGDWSPWLVGDTRRICSFSLFASFDSDKDNLGGLRGQENLNTDLQAAKCGILRVGRRQVMIGCCRFPRSFLLGGVLWSKEQVASFHPARRCTGARRYHAFFSGD